MRPNILKRISSKLKRFGLCSIYVVVMTICKLMIRIFKFKKITSLFSNAVDLDGHELTQTQINRTYIMRYCLELTLFYLPKFFVCYEQALASMFIARILKVPLVMSYGVQRSEEGLKAHAWTMSGDVIISGERELKGYKAVYQVAYVPGRVYD